MKRNCWEVKACGRQPRGAKIAELGVCPAALAKTLTGANGGLNGGRTCWVIAGTFCEGHVQGTFAEKRATCLSCDFYKLVKQEEGKGFLITGHAAKALSQV